VTSDGFGGVGLTVTYYMTGLMRFMLTSVKAELRLIQDLSLGDKKSGWTY